MLPSPLRAPSTAVANFSPIREAVLAANREPLDDPLAPGREQITRCLPGEETANAPTDPAPSGISHPQQVPQPHLRRANVGQTQGAARHQSFQAWTGTDERPVGANRAQGRVIGKLDRGDPGVEVSLQGGPLRRGPALRSAGDVAGHRRHDHLPAFGREVEGAPGELSFAAKLEQSAGEATVGVAVLDPHAGRLDQVDRRLLRIFERLPDRLIGRPGSAALDHAKDRGGRIWGNPKLCIRAVPDQRRRGNHSLLRVPVIDRETRG